MSSTSSTPNPLAPYYPDVGAPSAPSYPVDGLEPLSYELDPNGDGKTVYNPPRPDGKRSPHYDALYNDNNAQGSKAWWDFHVYQYASAGSYVPSDDSISNNPIHVKYAHKLYEAVRREFPELRVYRVS